MATKTKGQRHAEKSMPASSSSRLEKSRKLAQKRRETYKDLMTGIMESLPFTREVLSQLDYNSRLRLALCFLKMKSLVNPSQKNGPPMIQGSPDSKAVSKPVIFQPGAVQELMIEAMDGFLMVVLSDGSIVYLSESIHKHLGLFQSEHMGSSLYDLVLEEDHHDVRQALSNAETRAHTRMGSRGLSVSCSFFCRMKCSRNKIANTQSKSPGFKVVHTSGHFRLKGNDAYLVALVKPVTPPSILEIRMEGNMFVTHYALDMKCIFFDGRLAQLLGYKKGDLENRLIFDFHHHDDVSATMACSRNTQARGEGLSGYYRMITKHGTYVWLQTRASVMFDSHTGKPSYIVCMNFVIDRDRAIHSPAKWAFPVPPPNTKTYISEERSKAHDPFPIPREDGKNVYPFDDGYDDVPNTVKTPDTPDLGRVKVEEASPPLHEEPSSTTGAQGPTGNSPLQSGRGKSCRLQANVSGFHDNVPLGHVTSSSNECTPDSTTAHVSSDEYAQVDSGYSSRLQSTSSTMMQSESGSAFMSSPESTLSGSSSIPKPSATQFQDLFSESVQFVPVDPSSRSGSTSDLPHSSPAGPPSIYQLDPFIQEIPPSQCETTPTTQPCQVNRPQGFLQSRAANSPQKLYMSERQPVGVHGQQPESLRGSVTYSTPVQQPLGYHGNYAPPKPSSGQVDLNFNSPSRPQLVIKQEVSPEISCNPCSAPTNTFASYQYHVAQQLQENGEPSLPPDFNFAKQQQQLQHVEQNSTGVYMGTNHPARFEPVQNGCPGMSYSNDHVQMPVFTEATLLPGSFAQSIPSGNGRLHHPVNNFHHNTTQQCLFNSSPSTNTGSFTSHTTTPLSHPPTLEGISMSFRVEDVSFRGTTAGQHPDLVRLTGEDLQILEFIDQVDSVGSVMHLTPHSHHSLKEYR